MGPVAVSGSWKLTELYNCRFGVVGICITVSGDQATLATDVVGVILVENRIQLG